MERVLNASSQRKLVPFRSLVIPYKWKAHAADKCEVSEELIITEFNGMISFRCARILRCKVICDKTYGRTSSESLQSLVAHQ